MPTLRPTTPFSMSRLAAVVIPQVAQPSRPLIFFGLLAAFVLFGPVLNGDSAAQRLALQTFFVIILLLSFLTWWIARKSMVTDNPADVRRAVEASNGLWWARVLDADGRLIGLTVLHLELSPVGTGSRMYGTRYDTEGRHVFDWRTTAFAFEDVANLVFLYAWEGSPTHTPGTISGIGSYTLFSPNGRADKGHGWSVACDRNSLTFSDQNGSVLRRVTEDQAEAIARGGGARAAEIRKVLRDAREETASRNGSVLQMMRAVLTTMPAR